MKGSLIIVAFFVLGIVCGLFHLIPASIDISRWSYVALCALLFCVGISVGNDTQMLRRFRSLDPLLLLLPLMTIIGTLTGTAIISLAMPHRSLTECIAVGSGFAYYSLSSIFITQYRGPELGTVALLAKVSDRAGAVCALEFHTKPPFYIPRFRKCSDRHVEGCLFLCCIYTAFNITG